MQSVPTEQRKVMGKEATEKNFSRTPKVRREAGWRLLEERFEEITVVAEDYVRVPSRTRRGHFYTCNPVKRFCPCPDSQAGGNSCAHGQAASWARMIAQSGYRVERVHNSRLPFIEWHVFDRETGELEGVRYSLPEAVLDVIEMAEFQGGGS